MYYLDTSVLVAYYYPEAISESVEKFILQIKRPVISALTEVEFTSALSKKVREKELKLSDAIKVFNQFQSQLKNALFLRLFVDELHYQTAKSWIAQFASSLRTLDALHLAIASANGLTLVTADRLQTEAARFFGVEVQKL